MFTLILGFIGIFVFLISIFTANLKTAWKRLLNMILAGFVIDVLITIIFVIAMCFIL